jgi:hypothetical protein
MSLERVAGERANTAKIREGHRSDQSGQAKPQRLVYLNRPVWGTGLTGLVLTGQWLVLWEGVFIPHDLTHSGVLMLFHSEHIWEPCEHLESPPQHLFVRVAWFKLNLWVGLSKSNPWESFEQERYSPRFEHLRLHRPTWLKHLLLLEHWLLDG